MNKVLSFFEKRLSLIVFVCSFILLASVLLFQYTPIRLYPKASKAEIHLAIRYEGMNENEFRFRYGRNIENSLVSLEHRDEVRADYSSFYTRYEISFNWSLGLDEAKKNVKEYANSLSSFLPKNFRYWVRNAERGGSNLFAGVLSVDSDKDALTKVLKDQFVPAFESLKVANYAFAFNPLSENFVMKIHKDFFLHPLFDLAKIESSIKSRQFSSYLGSLEKEGSSNEDIYLSEALKKFEDLGKVDVFFTDKYHFHIDQFSDLIRDSKRRENEYYVSGKTILIAGAGAAPGANLKEFSSEFYRLLKDAISGFGSKVKISKILDPATFIETAVSKLYISVALSVAMTALVLFLSLGEMAPVFAACICIPFFLMGGFLLLRIFGTEINLISLSAMALSVGIAIDAAIVVIESMEASISQKQSIADGLNKIAPPLFFSLLTTVVVFLPLPFSSPITSALLGDLALVLICTVSFALLFSLTLLPSLVMAFKSKKAFRKVTKISAFFIGVLSSIRKSYLSLLQNLLSHKKKRYILYMGFAFFSLISTALSLNYLEKTIMNELSSDKVFLHVWLKNPINDVDKRRELLKSLKRRAFKKIKFGVLKTMENIRENSLFILFFLKNKDDLEAFEIALEKEFQNDIEKNFNIERWNPGSLNIDDPPIAEITFPARFKNQGSKKPLSELSDLLNQLESLGERREYPNSRLSESWTLTARNPFARRISSAVEKKIAERIQIANENRYIKNLYIEGEESEIQIKADVDKVSLDKELASLGFYFENTRYSLGSLFRLSKEKNGQNLFSINGSQKHIMELFLSKAFLGARSDVFDNLKNIIQDFNKKFSESLSIRRADQIINENILSLALCMGLSLLLIFFILLLRFPSFLVSLQIVSATLFGIVGSLIGLYLSGSSLNLNSVLGMILLAGLAVNNSIILFDFFEQESSQNLGIKENILLACQERFRPIFVTSLSTLLGMLPIAFAFGDGGKNLAPLGISVCSGLLLSVLGVLVILPCSYLDIKTSRTIDKV